VAVFQHINGFTEHACTKLHDFSTDTLGLALSNTAPASETPNPTDLTADCFLSNVTVVDASNLGVGDLDVPIASYGQVNGVFEVKTESANMVLTASGGSVGPFRYVYLYNKASDALIGFWDYGASITMQDGESVEIDFDADTNRLFWFQKN
jgi:hypothetical protein